jgi:hypothetical protein
MCEHKILQQVHRTASRKRARGNFRVAHRCVIEDDKEGVFKLRGVVLLSDKLEAVAIVNPPCLLVVQDVAHCK